MIIRCLGLGSRDLKLGEACFSIPRLVRSKQESNVAGRPTKLCSVKRSRFSAAMSRTTTNSSSSPDAPSFYGSVETTVDALRLILAAKQNVIGRITKRKNEIERREMVRSGAVLVFNVEESGIEDWTDGLLWTPSRIVGNFRVGPSLVAVHE